MNDGPMIRFVDEDKFSADKLAHPERWKWREHQIVWIADSGRGSKPIHFCFEWEDGRTGYDNMSCDRDHVWLTYTPPDPWEGVELPIVTVKVDRHGVNKAVNFHWGEWIPDQTLPPRKFKLVPM